MAKNSNQKLKILYIAKMLTENTDEEHSLSTLDIIERLSHYGIEAERKSIYADIENLQNFGMDILKRRSEPQGYYLASRDFELPELKLLVDSVQSSKFITEKKSRALIGKIEKLTSKFEATTLQSQVVVSNRIKTMNESIYYNVDKIHAAISGDVKIRYKYCEWTLDKELKPKKDGAFYTASPWVLTWDDENYYMIAYDEETQTVRHYRVDKMMNITLTNSRRDGKDMLKKIDIAAYARRTFGMFGGEATELDILFDKKLIGVVIDRFGKDAVIHKQGSDNFTARVSVNISKQFYGWLAALGDGAKIVSPQAEADKFTQYIDKILSSYK